MEESMETLHPGNAPRYSVENTPRLAASPLSGKTFAFLGSSVTFGSASLGESVPDFLGRRNGCVCVKEAVSGTTLADLSQDSYVRRLRRLDGVKRMDAFVCQLSTNDAALEGKGAVTDGFDAAAFDTKTTYGAIEHIISYVMAAWDCPVYFYTNAYYADPRYGEMVETLRVIARKWGVAVIDLYGDAAFNAIAPERRALYMNDDIHPTRAGYRDWWTPKFETYLK